MRASRWRYIEECDRLHWKFKAGRLTREEMRKFCSVFGLTHLVGFGAGGLPVIALVISANTTNYNLFTAVGSPAFPVQVNATINSGVYVYSTSISTPAFDVGSGWAAGSKLTSINNGFILGKGGKGAHWNGSSTSVGESGGNALKLQANIEVSVDNLNGAICGGGGGGSGWQRTVSYGTEGIGAGGGAGGGDGGTTQYPTLSASVGGTGGAPGAAGGNGTITGNSYTGGAGGGRIVPGTGGAGGITNATNCTAASQGGGSGGGGGISISDNGGALNAGAGGSADAAGGLGSVAAGSGSRTAGSGGGGGWGAAGGGGGNVAGGSGGKCVDLNGQSIVWINNGTRYGAIA